MDGIFDHRILDDSALAIVRSHLAPIAPLLAQPDVTDLVINRPGEVGVERAGRWEWHELAELDLKHLQRLATQLAGISKQDISAELPICSCVLPDGERCQIVMPPATLPGMVSITIRKPAVRDFTMQDLDDYGLFETVRPASDHLSPDEEELLELYRRGHWRAFLELAVRARKNIIVSGATGSAKTTLIKALSHMISGSERIITGEDTHELRNLPQRNKVNLLYSKDGIGLAKIGPRHLMDSSLRMRPDRVLFPELRDGTAFFYLRSVASGHPGSITSIHSDSTHLAWETLTLLVRESDGGRDLPRDDIRSLLYLTVDIIVQMKRVDGRYCMTEVYYDPHRKRQHAR